ncbi:MAG: response regulator transcription factor [Vicingaceae bacterium]
MGISVIVFDDNAKRREGLEMLLEATDGMHCTGTYNDCRDALRIVKEQKPDVILMDIDMPHVNGIEGVKAIRKEFKEVKILMQTVFEDDEKVFNAICAGANGYILKQTNPTNLVDSISEVFSGGGPMTPVIAAKVLQLFSKGFSPKVKETFDLTKRELEILQFLVKGFSYKMIANECHISYPTVNTHVNNIYKKLQVQSAAGAVSKAIKKGLVS